ncbi:MAG: hypothetical protein MUF64_29370 [Polyangiaceae bacterium]|nr:hypothetical protein [Polyangiaceae bacterium]
MTLAARLRRWGSVALAENLLLKVFCLLVSLLFYGHLHGARNAQRSFSLSVVTLLPGGDDGQVLMIDPPSTARVTLTGSRPILDDLKSDELGSVQLDLRQARGTYAPLDISRLKVPAGLSVEVDPPGVLLAWDAVVTRPVPVQIPLAGQEGLAMDGVVKRKLPLEMPPPRVTFGERNVMATVTLGRARTERVFRKLQVQVVGPTRSAVLPQEVDVRVAGPPDLVDDLRPELVVPIADVHAVAGDARTGSMPVPVAVVLDGCSTQVIPPTVVIKW